MKKILAIFLAVQVTFPVSLLAQQPANAEPVRAMIAGSLKVFALEGQGAINKIEGHQGTSPVIEVRDENDHPVEGATVVFRLPPTGPGAAFPGESLSRTLKTNSQGQAMAAGMTPNDKEGAFKIHVTATAGNKIGELDIDQTNSARIFSARPLPAKFKFSRKWKLVAIGVGVAAVVGIIVFATRSSTPAAAPVVVNPTITITPGPVTIGGR